MVYFNKYVVMYMIVPIMIQYEKTKSIDKIGEIYEIK